LAGGSIPPVGTLPLPLITPGIGMKRGASAGVVQRFLAFLELHNLTDEVVGIGLSGGADSTALAICAGEARRAGRLSPVLIHVDHGVRGDSSADCAIVALTADALKLELLAVQLQGLTAGSSEADMREARYGAFIDQLASRGASTVFTGHHARDQAETVILSLARGQGPEGASGMAPVERLTFGDAAVTVVRPFLEESPQSLADLVADYGLATLDDPTNASVDRARNLVRHRVIPALEEINPAAIQNIARSAEIARDENAALDTQVRDRLADLAKGPVLKGAALAEEPVAIQRRAIRTWVQGQTGTLMSFDRTEAVRRMISEGTGGVDVELGDGWIARQAKREVTLVRSG
jgi:tRNA(Ile)-lysidine synthase